VKGPIDMPTKTCVFGHPWRPETTQIRGTRRACLVCKALRSYAMPLSTPMATAAASRAVINYIQWMVDRGYTQIGPVVPGSVSVAAVLQGVSAATQMAAMVTPTMVSEAEAEITTAEAEIEEVVAEVVQAVKPLKQHRYRPNPELVDLWNAAKQIAPSAPVNILLVGPSGSGKTEGVRYLAETEGVPFTKIDAASMVDAESWFGTREVEVEQGASVTKYQPSVFVDAIQQPGIILIDEVNRVRDNERQVLLPLLDGTRQVMNPLNGQPVRRHPECYVFMAGNVGLQYTGTHAIDPAFTSRAVIFEFDYIPQDQERDILIEATGIDRGTAILLARFAGDARNKSKSDPDFQPVSTREVLEAAKLISRGLDASRAVKYAILNAASADGGAQSQRAVLETLWTGIGGNMARKAPRP
jgi:MoxR-like ATPase